MIPFSPNEETAVKAEVFKFLRAERAKYVRLQVCLSTKSHNILFSDHEVGA